MRAPAAKQRGFTYVGLLFAVAIIGLTLTVVSQVWRTTVQREREAELLWVGHAYRLAIASYFAFGHRYPAKLEDLVTDDRFPVPKHHLRKLYRDPMTGQNDWKLLLTADQSAIQGVASSSQAAPIKRDGFDLIDLFFKDAEHYSDWKFVYTGNRWGAGASLPVVPTATAPAPQPGSGAPTGPTTAPGIPLPQFNDNPSPSPPRSPVPGPH